MGVKCIFTVIVLSMVSIFCFSGRVFGGAGARNISSQSAQTYLVGGARWAEAEAGDTPLANPAGAAFMKDGMYIYLSAMIGSNSWALKEISTGKEYVTDAASAIPDLALTFKKNNWATFFTISFPGGTGGGNYERSHVFDYYAGMISDQLGTTVEAQNQKFDFGGGKMAFALGGAYRITDKISLAYAIRQVSILGFVDASTNLVVADTGQTIKDLRMNYDMTGDSIGHSFGVHFQPNEKLNIGLRYEPRIKITQKTELEKDDTSGAIDGEEKENNLPTALFSAATYQFTPKLKVNAGFSYYWQKGINGADEPTTEGWNNAWEAGTGFEYRFSPKFEILGGIGYQYVGIPDEAYTAANLSFDNCYYFTGGFIYTPIPKLDLIAGYGYTYYPGNPITEADSIGRYERVVKKTIQGYLGIEYRFWL